MCDNLENKHDLTRGSTTKVFLGIALPLAASFIMHSLYNIVDAMYLGRLSNDALAAVSFVIPIFFFMFSIGVGIASGTSSLISRFIGARQYKKVRNTYTNAILFGAICNLILLALAFTFQKTLYLAMGAKEEMLDLILSYSNIFLWFIFFLYITVITNHSIRAEGNAKYVMFVLLTGSILNIILDPIFIFVLGMGIKGAAIATVLAQIVAFLIAFHKVTFGKSIVKFSLKDYKLDFGILKEILKVGLPAGLSNVLTSITVFFMTAIATSFGINYVAAYTVGFRLEGFLLMPTFAFMNSTIVITGQCFGANKISRAKESIREGMKIASISYVVMVSLIMLFSRQIANFFTDDMTIIPIISKYILILAPSYLLFALSMISIGALMGVGKPMVATVTSILRLAVITIPMAYLLTNQFGFFAIPIAINAGFSLSAILTFIWYKNFDFEKIRKESAHMFDQEE